MFGQSDRDQTRELQIIACTFATQPVRNKILNATIRKEKALWESGRWVAGFRAALLPARHARS